MLGGSSELSLKGSLTSLGKTAPKSGAGSAQKREVRLGQIEHRRLHRDSSLSELCEAEYGSKCSEDHCPRAPRAVPSDSSPAPPTVPWPSKSPQLCVFLSRPSRRAHPRRRGACPRALLLEAEALPNNEEGGGSELELTLRQHEDRGRNPWRGRPQPLALFSSIIVAPLLPMAGISHICAHPAQQGAAVDTRCCLWRLGGMDAHRKARHARGTAPWIKFGRFRTNFGRCQSIWSFDRTRANYGQNVADAGKHFVEPG